jgi:DNA-binding beta-propeller fold protein YncE
MSQIGQKSAYAIKRKYVYGLIQLIFVINVVGFLYTYITNRDVIAGVQEVAASQPGEPDFVRFIYGAYGGGELAKPMAVTATNNRIYVSDTKNCRIQIFDIDGNPMKTFGKYGKKAGEFQFPYGLAADSKGNIYVADLYSGTVTRFDQEGKFLGTVVNKGSSAGIQSPAGLAIKNNLLYVTDVKECNVQIFDLNGKPVQQVSSGGRTPGKLYAPNAIAVDNKGTMYVTDTGNSRVQVFDKTGKLLRIINGSPDGKGQPVLTNPRGVAVDKNGNVYVVSNLTHMLYGFDKNGARLFAMGKQGEGEKQFFLPNGLFIDDNNFVYVTETANIRVSVFQLP